MLANLTILAIFYANYIVRDGSNVLVNLTILAIFIKNYITRDESYVLGLTR